MSDLMREEFEATYKIEVIRQGKTFDSVVFTRESSGEYIVGLVQSAWWAWQASRECLVIDLPDTKEIMPLSPGMYVHEMRKIVDENKYTRAIDLARCAIHAAGVKTK